MTAEEYLKKASQYASNDYERNKISNSLNRMI